MAQESWKDLKDRSAAYCKGAEHFLNTNDDDLIQNALEQIHLAVELAMKSVIAKYGGQYPDRGFDGHDLLKLIKHRYPPQRSIYTTMKARKELSKANISLSKWTMDCRYKKKLDYANMKASLNDYKELYLWIRDNLLT